MLLVCHKYIQYLISTIYCISVYTIKQIFEEWCFDCLCIHMYKKNNLDLKFLQNSDRQNAELQALQDYLQGNIHFFLLPF